MKNTISKAKNTSCCLNFVALMAITMGLYCCVEDEYSIPNALGNEENAGLAEIMNDITNGSLSEISVQDLKNLYAGQVVEIDSDLVIKGYVTSSDQTGNFYKEFYLQDSPENPTAALGVRLNMVDSYNMFNQGREVYIKLKGLYLGHNDSEVITIGGSEDGDRVGEITANMIPDFIFRSSTTVTMIPLMAGISDVNESYTGMLVTLGNVQFPMELAGKTFVDPYDDYDSQRTLTSCTNGSEIYVETSSFANFAQVPLPVEGGGSITGVVVKSYGGDDLVFYLNNLDDIHFDQDRCDPVFEATFTGATDNTVFNFPGWINYAEAGTAYWMEDVFGGNAYARFTAYQSGNSSNIGWLVTPPIDLDAQDGEILTFDTEHAYPDSGHDPLDVLISTDFDGTESGIGTATWQPLSFDKSYVVDYGSWFSFTPSGNIDLSTYSGTAYIAFRYTGGGSGQDMTLDVDNVRVSAP